MAAADNAASAPVRKRRAEARRSERTPSGGWRTIAAKELADHLTSMRFFVLLIVVGLLAVLPMIFASADMNAQANSASGASSPFLLLFTYGSPSFGGYPMMTFVYLLVPLVGVAFGFDGINSERSSGTLSRLLAQPIHRDDVVNGKFVAGIAVIALLLAMLILVVTGIGILRLGIVPDVEQAARVVVWFLATVLYASVWLAFALLISTVVRSTATSALAGFGVWIGFTLFGSFLLPIVGQFLFPVDTSGTLSTAVASSIPQQLFLHLSPATLYQDIVKVVLNPQAGATDVFITSANQVVAGQQQIPGLLSLDQSLLIVWPQIVALTALTVLLFAISYVLFLRQEVRA
ncbi:MAG: ABC transporter permease [Candidatus Limnocylindrales bacterium]